MLKLIFLLLFFLTAFQNLNAQQISDQKPRNENKIEISYAQGKLSDKQFFLRGIHYWGRPQQRIRPGMGLQGSLIAETHPVLLPASRILREYPQTDSLQTEKIRIWNAGLVLSVQLRIYKKIALILSQEIATVSAGKSIEFKYHNPSDPHLFEPIQEARPSPSGFIGFTLKSTGTLNRQISLVFPIHHSVHAGAGYSRTRYEYMTSRLLNFRNDQFIRSSHMIHVSLGYTF